MLKHLPNLQIDPKEFLFSSYNGKWQQQLAKFLTILFELIKLTILQTGDQNTTTLTFRRH